ncbi:MULTISPECIES: metal ABC transporter substrate-binding protein [Actinotignum]|uniref:Metal ABC transporter substrate-binding protein n=1 Tax=Actinotignum timonense TaxID=1870995 RepID=A0AAW9HPF5_9ACTO|nr:MULTISPECIES: metal ABC transporter substrate-binding protein [Actinotignum]MBS5748079.1 metal ABC transporter substrate-binding protein [Actinotignum schaalii]MDE1535994.1 metal ABC transporter substrate-binding protein [Actinotignum schaalii]MDE1559015.1 metal ABC transporter substrate-binding protein [Actinotignum schaalii]MDE1664011.1 metal ABC transporter substrate-binding protein [Actinotignum schaalii]MDK6373031.1 metal ABC transporter substrate-binding protein [Actinotignum timonens
MGIGYQRGAVRAGLAALLASMLALLGACGAASSPEKSAGSEKPQVLTTFTVLADMASNIAGEHMEVASITNPGEEIHDYQPSPGDIKRAEGADIILYNGLGLERWFEKFVENSTAERINLSDGIEPVAIAEGDYQGKPNPHAWMSPKNGKLYVDNMVAAFAKVDPAHAEDYRTNGENYKKQLDAIASDMDAALATIPESQRALVSCEGAFSYLTRDHGLQEKYLWAVNAEGAQTPKAKADLENFVRTSGVRALFCESTVDDKMASVAEDTGVPVAGLLYVDSLSEADGPVPTYLDLLRYDADLITRGLTGKASESASEATKPAGK